MTWKKSSPIFFVAPKDVLFRIFASFVPPFRLKYRETHEDLLGPLLGFLFLTALLVYGYSFKIYKSGISPIEVMLTFGIFMPFVSHCLGEVVGKANLSILQTITLIGYSLYGHFLTLLVSFIFFHETSNTFFFICLIVFGGLSTLRLALVYLLNIPEPGARLLVCSTISTMNILFLIYLHFGFMHKTYAYGKLNEI